MRQPLAALVLSVVLVGCSDQPSNAPSDETRTGATSTSPTATTPTALEVAEVATGLTSPWGLVVLDDGRLLVGERDTRRIKLVDPAGGEARVVATVADVVPAGEGGLLGLVATPDGDTVLAYFTSVDDNRIVAMSWDGTRLGAPEVLVDGIPHGSGSRHEGGRMVIGPDGLLYVGTGETGSTPEIAQDRDSLGGKVLRYTLEGEPAPGNPFDSPVLSYGHRNVEGLAFDADGNLWASEFGENEWDELNLIRPGGNYGWPEVEGSSSGTSYRNPAAVWRTADASPSGLAFWDGSLWMAGLRGERLWEIPVDHGEVGDPVPHLAGEYGRLRSVAVDADGSGLLVTTSNTDGRGTPNDGDDRVLRVTR